MMNTRLTTGLALAGAYVVLSLFLILTQGLFGESFIALILGMPWTLLFAYFEFGGASGPSLVLMLVVPMILNAAILFGLGYLIGKRAGPAKAVAIGVALVALLVTGFFAFNSYIYSQKQQGGEVTSYRGTLTGVQTCLPHKDKDGPHTMECAIGMKTDSGEHYALDFAAMSQIPPAIQDGDRFEATGLITPVEMLSTEQWRKYDIVGIFSVTDSVKKL